MKGAQVSAPLEWSEVKEGLSPAAFTIKTAPKRYRSPKDDPMAPLLTTRADVRRALDFLSRVAERQT